MEKGFLEMYKENDIITPKLLVTDRELVLLNTLDKLFPTSNYILCRWHININVIAKIKKYFKT